MNLGDPAVLGVIPRIPKKISEDDAEIDQLGCLEERLKIWSNLSRIGKLQARATKSGELCFVLCNVFSFSTNKYFIIMDGQVDTSSTGPT